MMLNKSAKGFVLMEILVSVVVFSMGVLFLVQTLSRIVRSNQKIRDNSISMLMIDNLINRWYSGEQIDSSGLERINNKEFRWDIEHYFLNDKLKDMTVNITWHKKNDIFSASLTHRVIVIE